MKVLRVLLVVLLFPLALCLGVYGCVAVHVAAVSSALSSH
jgi:hypothetical protein